MKKQEAEKNKTISGTKRFRNRLSPVDKKEMPVSYLMLLPVLLILTIFVWVPFVYALERSFWDWNFYKDSEFVGLRNFELILRDKSFRKSVVNGFKFVIIQVPIGIAVQFLFANMIKKTNARVQNTVKGIIYIPAILSGIMASVIATFILNYRGGILNQVLMALGFDRFAFGTDKTGWAATWVIVIMNTWLGFGGGVILMYAALNSIDTSFYEASAIDGAGKFQQMLYITLPQMKNIFILVGISGTTGTLQMFDIPFMLTGGGPLEETLTPMLFIYNNMRDSTKGMGYTIAGALIMMVIITSFNVLLFALVGSEKNQE